LAILIVAAPFIIAGTGLRDRAINAILASPSVEASSDRASFGWFSPLSVDGLQLNSTNKHVEIRVDGVAAERSPLQLLTTAPDLGPVRAEKPRVRLTLPLDVEIPRPGSRLEPTFTAVVTDASLTVLIAGQDEPVIDVDGIDMTFRVEQAEDGRVLTLDPLVVFDRRKLSTERANRLLHLFDPTMGDIPQAGGEYSLSLDKLRVPIGLPRDEAIRRLEVEGKLVLHDVSGEVKNPLRLALVHLLAEMNGKDPSNVVRLARNDEIRFRVRDGRLYHEGLRIGFPDIDPGLVLTSRGSIGLDKTVDLFVELPRLDRAQWKGKGPAKCRITGTVTDPRIAVEDGSLAFRLPGHKERIIAADGIALNMRIETTAAGNFLVVEPVEILKRTKLDVAVAAGLLKWLAPDVQADRHVSGEVSLALSKLRVPLGVAADQAAKQAEADGKLTLHRVESEVKSPIWQALVRLAADMYGKQSVPGVVRLVADAEVPFRVREGRLHHDGARVGFPDIDPGLVVTTHGSVGLDETVDLYAELPRPALPGQKEGRPARCRITGTVADPRMAVEDGSLVLRLPGRKEPIIAADGINLNMRVETTPAGRVFVVDPVEIFKQTKVDVAVAAGLLKWLAPDVQADRQVSGEVSLALTKLRIPLGVDVEQAAKQAEAEGKLTLHRVESEVKSSMWQGLIRLLADLHGKPVAGAVRLVADAEVPFRVRDGRLHHDGMRVGFPDIDPTLVVTTRGSVGLDETVDLQAELPRPALPGQKEGRPAKCRITGTVADPRIAVEDGSLVLQQPGHKDPIIAADGINLNMRVETTPAGRVLAVEPIEVFKNKKLKFAVAAGLVRLLAPDVRTEREVTGEISLSFDKLRVPLGVPAEQAIKELEAEGELRLHQFTSDVKSPTWQAVVRLLADMNGKKPTDVIRVVEESDIRFRVSGGRVYHEGQRIGFPDIDPGLMVTSRGSIGLDETLDLFVELPHLDPVKRKEKGPAKCHITGTVAEPKIAVENGSLVLRQHDRKEPIIAADGLSLNLRVENTPSGRVLAVEPVEVLKKAQLNLGVAAGLLRLMAPDVESDRQVSGEVSLALTKFRIPLGVDVEQAAKQAEVEGKLSLHRVESEVKSPMWQALVRLAADMNGKQSTGAIRLVADAEVPFRVREGRLHYDEARVGFPDIDPGLVVNTSGSVGIDEKLDLLVELPRLRKGQLDKGPLRCRITGTVRDPAIAIADAQLIVRLKDGNKAALTVDGKKLSFRVEDTKVGRVLTLKPVTVFEKRKLTPELGDELLHLIVPTLSDLTGVQGEISLSFDTLRVPLGVPKGELEKRVELAGKLLLHQVSVSTRTPLLQEMVKVLADMHGKKPSDVVRVVKNDEVRFKVKDGRMYHEGLRIGFPDIAPELMIRSHGSVGFDKSLDFELEVPSVLADKSKVEIKEGPPVHFRVTGTIEKPTVTEIKPDKPTGK
jgi:hypothetical protein